MCLHGLEAQLSLEQHPESKQGGRTLASRPIIYKTLTLLIQTQISTIYRHSHLAFFTDNCILNISIQNHIILHKTPLKNKQARTLTNKNAPITNALLKIYATKNSLICRTYIRYNKTKKYPWLLRVRVSTGYLVNNILLRSVIALMSGNKNLRFF